MARGMRDPDARIVSRRRSEGRIGRDAGHELRPVLARSRSSGRSRRPRMSRTGCSASPDPGPGRSRRGARPWPCGCSSRCLPPFFDSHMPYFEVFDRRLAPAAGAAADDRRIDMVGIVDVDDDLGDRDAVERLATDRGPMDAAVGRLQEAIPEVAVARQVALAGAGVDDRVVGWCDGDRADRQGRLIVRPRDPHAVGLVIGPDPALRRAQDLQAVAGPDRKRADTAGHGIAGCCRRG